MEILDFTSVRCPTIESLTPLIGQKRAREHSDGCKKCGVKATPVAYKVDNDLVIEIVYNNKLYVTNSPSVLDYMREGLFCECWFHLRFALPPVFKATYYPNEHLRREVTITFGYKPDDPNALNKCTELLKTRRGSYLYTVRSNHLIVNIDDKLYTTPINDQLCQYLSVNTICKETLKDITAHTAVFEGIWKLVLHKSVLPGMRNLTRPVIEATLDMLKAGVPLKSIEVMLEFGRSNAQDFMSALELYFDTNTVCNILNIIGSRNINLHFDSNWSIINNIGEPTHDLAVLYIEAIAHAVTHNTDSLNDLITDFEIILGKVSEQHVFDMCKVLFNQLFEISSPSAISTIKHLKPYL
jgi:hypothetical protein